MKAGCNVPPTVNKTALLPVVYILHQRQNKDRHRCRNSEHMETEREEMRGGGHAEKEEKTRAGRRIAKVKLQITFSDAICFPNAPQLTERKEERT